MRWFLRTFWRTLTFVGTLVGLLFLASDYSDFPDAVSAWRSIVAMIELETALWIFSLCALAYIFWIDLRPTVADLRAKRGLIPAPTLSYISAPVEVEGATYYKNFLLLPVYNDSRNRATAKDVRVRAYTTGQPIRCLTVDGEESVNIHYGEIAYFVIGSVMSSAWFGMPQQDLTVTDVDIQEAKFNLPNGSYSLDLNGFRSIAIRFLGVDDSQLDLDPISFLKIRVSSEGQKTHQVSLRCNPSRLDQLLGGGDPPFEIVSVTVL